MTTTKRMGLLASLSVLLAMYNGCSRHDNSERYILVTVNTKLPYRQTAA